MSFNLVNHKEVKNDIYEIKHFYKSKLIGLEKRFVSEVKKKTAFIAQNPLLFQKKISKRSNGIDRCISLRNIL